MKLTSSTNIASSYNESYFVKFSEFMNFLHQPSDMFVIKSLTTVAKCLTRKFEEETHKIKNEKLIMNNEGILMHNFLSNLFVDAHIKR